MLERFTVDVIVDEIDRQVKGANPNAKLSHRFFRKGRRDGKRQLPADSMRAFVTEAVGLATSKLGQEHLAATEAARRQLAALEARRDQLVAALAKAPDPPAAQESEPSSGGAPFSENQPGPLIKGERLDDAMAALRAKRKEQAIIARGAQRAQDEAELEQVELQLAAAEDELERAPERFRQIVASAHQVGKLLWARYCVGFDGGKAKRGRPDDAEMGPSPAIDFPYPESLERTVEAAARPVRPRREDGSRVAAADANPAREGSVV